MGSFVDKCLSLLRLGTAWFSRLLAGVVEAARTRSYMETVTPSQADSLHQAVKGSDAEVIRQAFQAQVRKILPQLRVGRVRVAIDTTEEPYWGKAGYENTRPAVHEGSDESWQYVNLALVVPKFVPLLSLPYRQVDDLDAQVIVLLEYLRTLPLHVDLVLFDRGFYHAHLIDYLENRRGGRPWPYLMLVPRTEAVKGYHARTDRLGVFRHTFDYAKEKSTWNPTTTIVICKGVGTDTKGNPLDWCFATNQRPRLSLVWAYKKRWNIETGFRIQDEATIKSKSSHPLIRYFYHLVSLLLILTWRAHTVLYAPTVFKRYLKHIELLLSSLDKPPSRTTVQ